MTFDDDMIRLLTESGPRELLCAKNGIEWPPPEEIDVMGFRWRLVRRSQITDEQRAGMTHVFRGAEYEPIAHQS